MGNITTTKLVVDADAETRSQAIELYEGITGAERVDYLKFLEEEAAHLHDQPGATGIQSARIFNWLEDVFVSNGESDDEENKNDEFGTFSGHQDVPFFAPTIYATLVFTVASICMNLQSICGFLLE